MSVQRNDSASRPPDQAARNRQVDREAKTDTKETPPRERVDQFRSMMQQARGDMPAALHGDPSLSEGALTGEGELSEGVLADEAGQHEAVRTRQSVSEAVDARTFRQQHEHAFGMQSQGMESAAMLQAQMALRDGASAAAPAAASANAGQLFDMMEKHVRQMAVHDARDPGGDGQVLLRMADATLPGTDLLLSKSADGWVLRADSRSRDSFDAIREAGPQLAKRFAEHNLGTLTIDPHYHG
ncbi:hypothetical protein CNR27_01645 [Luteimonas chenhongjianii]|uniref:Flagellar hook-length control protein FliK n=1 Tax=Luteimonas chenhongjianii TaxID=2006110 RepID=A0A290XB33_9GAMM|nr:hypothetical protein [Luteimonas chenhongjianii]ATD66309.1 hypothetical protein CNR27_01645 [Luteimonas chenhongjianii]